MAIPGSSGNQLLGRLCAGPLAKFEPEMGSIIVACGQRLIEHHSTISAVVFPIDCVISRTYSASCGHSAELGMVGFEGAAGITVFLGSGTAAYDAIAHVGGRALAMRADIAKAMFLEDQQFQSAVLSHVRAMLRQISQIDVCNSLHSTEQRLCRWLLMTLERAPTSSFNLTPGTIAQLLSVRRESITSALGKLQNDGIIHTARGHIDIIDVSRLMAASCECYDAIRAEYDWSGRANVADKQRTVPSSAYSS